MSILCSLLVNTLCSICLGDIVTFFAHADSIGTGRYLPNVGYFPGKVELDFYVGAGNEGWGLEVFPIWIPNVVTRSWTSVDSANRAAEYIRKSGRMSTHCTATA
jgi:hypothetical protein